MIHAIVADVRTVRVFEASPPGRTLVEVAVFRNPLGELKRRLQPALSAAALKAVRARHG
jgi:hypothetical protein